MNIIDILIMAIIFDQVKLRDILYIDKLVINTNDCLCITGDNGSGKSTLCGLLATLWYPDSGTIKINGRNITTYNTCPVAMTLQNAKMQVLKAIVAQDIAFGLENKNMNFSIMDKKINESLEYFNLVDLKFNETSKLSGGQLQRVLFSSVDVLDSDIVIFDEPLAMIDYDNREIFYNYIRKLKSEGKTIIIVSHILDKKLECNRQITLENGEIKYDGIYLPQDDTSVLFNNEVKTIPYNDPCIEIENLSFSYGNKKILSNISMSVGKEEIVGVLGETGSGKTTLLNLIIGIEQSENIKVNCDISFALQHPQEQICNVKVLDEVAYNIIAKQVNKKIAYEKARDILNILNSELIDKDVYELSQGQLRLVTIASAIASNSNLILFDEITAHLDKNTINKVFRIIKERKITCIMVSHDAHILKENCTSIYKLHNKDLRRIF